MQGQLWAVARSRYTGMWTVAVLSDQSGPKALRKLSLGSCLAAIPTQDEEYGKLQDDEHPGMYCAAAANIRRGLARQALQTG